MIAAFTSTPDAQWLERLRERELGYPLAFRKDPLLRRMADAARHYPDSVFGLALSRPGVVWAGRERDGLFDVCLGYGAGGAFANLLKNLKEG